MRLSLIIILALCLQCVANAQSGSRATLDEERQYIDLESEEGYEFALKALAQDSNYYLGWLYMGAYLYDRAADQIGYAKSTLPLLQAKKLIEKDYVAKLKERTSNETTFFDNYYLYQDYNYLSFFLREAYNVMARPDSSFWIVGEYQKFDFQKDLAYFNGPFLSKAWIVYRYRTFTQDDFSFLRGSLEENMAYIHQLMDSSKNRIQRNIKLNNQAVFYFGNEADMTSYYHFESIVYAYEKEYEKAEKAYREMEEYGAFSYNNYALMKMSEGKFAEAMRYFDFIRKAQPYEKVLEEWIYYQSLLNTYQNKNKESIEQIKNWIEIVGSTPGYGWYNIALARAYLYQGDLESASKSLQKAKNFTEYHIGTTLGQESYEQAIEFLDVLLESYKLQALKFENPRWYFSLRGIAKYISQRWRLLLKRWNLLNKIAGYSDRDKIVYDLFSGESTQGWYETLYSLKSYSHRYFIQYYQQLMQQENTPTELSPYYNYAIALIESESGNHPKVLDALKKLSSDTTGVDDFSSLLVFMIYDLEADEALVSESRSAQQMYGLYPTLLPYTERTMTFNLVVDGSTTPLVEDCIERMQKCRINWIESAEDDLPTVVLHPLKIKSKEYIELTVTQYGDELITPYKQELKEAADGVKLAYAIFDVYGRNKSQNAN